ncbi:Nudix family hydrolase [Luteimonas viscosa]|uniref:Nudix family hydrolase n=1 Tax=Luteimonas viscosa TaxID=1132694 RepID=UPI0021CC88BC|nr:Nudix family hydrolase [Luteimonas viscosa]
MDPPGATHVVAGVIVDARGRVLLARRTAGRELAGLWEFPGGKVEPGETPEAALARELDEELGIEVELGDPLMVVPHLTPTRRLRLDVRGIRAWRGTPKGYEGQALAWVQPGALPRYDMPDPDRPVVAALLQPDHCLVTPPPGPGDSDATWLAALESALARGVRRVQFRMPGIDRSRRQQLLANAALHCAAAGAQLLVNGDARLACESGLGLHLPAARLRECRARPVADDQPLSASCHDAEELKLAQALGCDFALVGPVHPTPTHPGHGGIGWAGFEALREQASLPIYAIGGLGVDDIAAARSHGAQGIAAIRGLWEA